MLFIIFMGIMIIWLLGKFIFQWSWYLLPLALICLILSAWQYVLVIGGIIGAWYLFMKWAGLTGGKEDNGKTTK